MYRILLAIACSLLSAGCVSLPKERLAPPERQQHAVLADDQHASRTIDVLTFNIEGLPWPARRGRTSALQTLGSILKGLNEHGRAPDVILVQEMFSSSAVRAMSRAGYRYRAWGPSRTQKKKLRSVGRLSGSHRWTKGETGFHLVGSGLAILSRYPIVAATSEPYGTGHCAGFDCLSNKGVQHVRIAVPGIPIPIDLFNTHLNSQAESRVSPLRHGEAQALQRADLKAFVGYRAGPKSPTIIGGDFNMAGTPERLSLLESALSRFTMVHRHCAKNPTCNVQISWDGDEPWIDTEDLQLYRSSDQVRITPIRVEAMFDGSNEQPQLSDHDGLRVTYRLDSSPLPQKSEHE